MFFAPQKQSFAPQKQHMSSRIDINTQLELIRTLVDEFYQTLHHQQYGRRRSIGVPSLQFIFRFPMNNQTLWMDEMELNQPNPHGFPPPPTRPATTQPPCLSPSPFSTHPNPHGFPGTPKTRPDLSPATPVATQPPRSGRRETHSSTVSHPRSKGLDDVAAASTLTSCVLPANPDRRRGREGQSLGRRRQRRGVASVIRGQRVKSRWEMELCDESIRSERERGKRGT